MLEKLKRLLASPRMPVAAMLLALLLVAPTIGTGLFMDDVAHQASYRSEFRQPGGPRGDWDIFNFQSSDQGYLRHQMDKGLFPWWTPPSFRLAFFRPLTSLTHALDYRTWPGSPWIMHLENIALYGLMALFAGLLYRRLVHPAWAAGLAALLFAADDAHSMVVVWIANRNALLAGALGFAALVAHDHARRGSRPAAIAAPALYTLALLAGEAAVGAAAYLAAYALFLDERPAWSRARSLLPYAAASLGWLAIYKGLGYGAYGGGFYLDPASEPLAFAKALIERVPLLLLAQFGGFPGELWGTVPREKLAPIIAAIWALLTPLGFLVYRVAVRTPEARFFALGMLLSLLPVSATWPADRLLLFSGLGAFGLIAIFIARAADAAGRAARALAIATAALFLFIHGVVASVLLPVRAVTLGNGLRDYLARAESSLPSDPDLPRATVVVLNAPDVLLTNLAFADRANRGGLHPNRAWLLALVHAGRAELTRIDANTLAMTQSEGFLHEMWSLVFRGPSVPFQAGDVIQIEGLRIEIAEITPDRRPRRVLFRFDEPLDSDTFRWVRWEGTGYVPTAPPAAGETQIIPTTEFTEAVFGMTRKPAN